MPAVICLGDRTTSGCVVISVKQTLRTIDGKPVATLGDQLKCAKGGNCNINQASSISTINGVGVAYTGCTTTCGASLLGSTSLSDVNG